MRKTAAIILAAAVTGCAYQPQRPPPPITEGMDTATLVLYYGNPHHINRASYGEQWVFRTTCQVGPLFQDTLYVYVNDGHVEGWQQFACR